uniref:Uncharacterized protein n=1 Tax=Chromera velia CCMP2878 TaxID=1169474 RepID=A0A0G4G5W9_9ALVE|eukprot:Cvel_4187.t1-p1 / transcript=Cvel_4187.t1 / gene=Cvel_4187 / organism=Chromera_velia_CCMP2878 / gene_product=hypothetical protein / transcript_product=hypothetical protein / location=Cvel_scaffold180:101185-109749(-) / protein_length=396 / sequence_SO=supercontig / SO=protein_coding / is_pseudo=false
MRGPTEEEEEEEDRPRGRPLKPRRDSSSHPNAPTSFLQAEGELSLGPEDLEDREPPSADTMGAPGIPPWSAAEEAYEQAAASGLSPWTQQYQQYYPPPFYQPPAAAWYPPWLPQAQALAAPPPVAAVDNVALMPSPDPLLATSPAPVVTTTTTLAVVVPTVTSPAVVTPGANAPHAVSLEEVVQRLDHLSSFRSHEDHLDLPEPPSPIPRTEEEKESTAAAPSPELERVKAREPTWVTHKDASQAAVARQYFTQVESDPVEVERERSGELQTEGHNSETQGGRHARLVQLQLLDAPSSVSSSAVPVALAREHERSSGRFRVLPVSSSRRSFQSRDTPVYAQLSGVNSLGQVEGVRGQQITQQGWTEEGRQASPSFTLASADGASAEGDGRIIQVVD